MTLLIFTCSHQDLNEIVIPPVPACRGTEAKRSGEPALSEVEGDLLFLFYPTDLTAPNKSHHPPLCHPERSRGICGVPRLPHKGFRSVSSPTESSSLSGAPHRLIVLYSACGAESKDPGGA